MHGSTEVEFQVVSLLDASDVALNDRRGLASGFEETWRAAKKKLVRRRVATAAVAAIVSLQVRAERE